MRFTRGFSLIALTVLFIVGSARLSICQQTTPTAVHDTTAAPKLAVGPQYDTTHVYVSPGDFDRFVASVVSTFGGTTSKQVVTMVTPTPSSTISQLILTPVGTVSVFGYKTPVPFPFGDERN